MSGSFIFIISNKKCLFCSTGSAATLDLGFDVPPPIKTVTVEGSRLLIPCQPIRGEKGLPNVTWTNEESVVNEPRRHVLPNGTLLITEVSVQKRPSGKSKSVSIRTKAAETEAEVGGMIFRHRLSRIRRHIIAFSITNNFQTYQEIKIF